MFITIILVAATKLKKNTNLILLKFKYQTNSGHHYLSTIMFSDKFPSVSLSTSISNSKLRYGKRYGKFPKSTENDIYTKWTGACLAGWMTIILDRELSTFHGISITLTLERKWTKITDVIVDRMMFKCWNIN